MPEACNFIKKETLPQVFSFEFCKTSKNTFFTEHVWATASIFDKVAVLSEPAALSKKIPAQVLSCEICNYYEEHLWISTCKLYSKRDSNIGLFLWILWIIQEHLFCRWSTNGITKTRKKHPPGKSPPIKLPFKKFSREIPVQNIPTWNTHPCF